MKKEKIIKIIVIVLLLVALAAGVAYGAYYGGRADGVGSGNVAGIGDVSSGNVAGADSADNGNVAGTDGAGLASGGSEGIGGGRSISSAEDIVLPVVAEGEETLISLKQGGSTASGKGVEIRENLIIISKGGVYRINGTLSDGQLYVDVPNGEGDVVLLFDGVDITRKEDAALYVENAEHTYILLEEGRENRLQSGEKTEIVTAGGSGQGASADTAEQEASADDTQQGSVADNSGQNSSAATDEDAKGGALYSRDDLTIAGNGGLQVYGYLNNGIHVTNRLTIQGGSFEIEALNNGIKGKDSLAVSGGSFSIRAEGDGMKSDDTSGEGYGAILLTGGDYQIESGGDCIQAETSLEITAGSFDLTAGGGSADVTFPQENGWGRPGSGWDMQAESEESTKGLKSGTSLVISGGTFQVDTKDDAFHTNGSMLITAGTYTVASGDDAFHADTEFTIQDGVFQVTSSYEGLEAVRLLIAGGDLNITASDDGINANGGTSGFGGGFGFGKGSGFGGELDPGKGSGFGGNLEDPEAAGMGRGRGGKTGGGRNPGLEGDSAAEGNGTIEGSPGAADDSYMGQNPEIGQNPGMGQNPGEANSSGSLQSETEEDFPNLHITGGTLVVNAEGDGIDSNGDLIIDGGTILVNGPDRTGNGALDVGTEAGGKCLVNGGTVLALGSSGMAQTFEENSQQCSFRYDFPGTYQAGDEITVMDAEGNLLYSHTAVKAGSSVVFSSPDLKEGETYTVQAGDLSAEVTLTGKSTASGQTQGFGRGSR